VRKDWEGKERGSEGDRDGYTKRIGGVEEE
jgi:hypothetical protein